MTANEHSQAYWLAKIASFSNGKALCVGDAMLDRFVYGSVERLSPEAPIPVLREERDEYTLGGAANVAANLARLGAKVHFLSVLGDDRAGGAIAEMCADIPGITFERVLEKNRPTTTKTRFVGGQQQLLRVDSETVAPIGEATESALIAFIKAQIGNAQVLILSDYAKGVLTPRVVTEAIKFARAAKVPVIVDPKRRDFATYSGASIITPNLHELAQATHLPVGNDAEIEAACRHIIKEHNIGAALVTRGARGMTLVASDGEATHLPTQAREVFDVSGAGDTALACLAAGIGAGLPVEEAMVLANFGAGIAVGRLGTAQVRAADLRAAVVTTELISGVHKILPLEAVMQWVGEWRRKGVTIGFTNGCFDLIHPGHVSLLELARARCGKLIVGVNTDASVKRLKGNSRPVQNEMARAVVLASLAAVDAVILFDQDTPLELIQAIRPDVLVKGADYTKDKVVGGAFVESYGGTIYLAPIAQGNSTSNLISKINNG